METEALVMNDEQQAWFEQAMREFDIEALEEIATLWYDDSIPAKAEAATQAENRLAERAGHIDPCGYTLEATVEERIAHYHYHEPECDGFSDEIEAAERIATTIPLETAAGWAHKALEDRYEDGYGPGAEERGVEVAYIAAAGVVEQGKRAIEFLRAHYPVVQTALAAELERLTPTEDEAGLDWQRSLVEALNGLSALDPFVTGRKVD